jgi:hypothetical protein
MAALGQGESVDQVVTIYKNGETADDEYDDEEEIG